MEHPAEGTLLEWLDGRLARPEHATVQAHVAACGSCAALADRLRRLAAICEGAMAALNPPAPTEAAYAALLRRRRGWAAGARRTLARAAMLVLVVVGVASATLPSSSLRRWLAGPPATHRAVAPAPGAGVEILALNDSVRIVVDQSHPDLRVRVRVVDTEYVDVRGVGAAENARFRTAPGRVSVTATGAGEIHVTLPRGVRRAIIAVGQRAYVIKEGDQLHVLAPSADTAGTEISFPTSP